MKKLTKKLVIIPFAIIYLIVEFLLGLIIALYFIKDKLVGDKPDGNRRKND